MAEVMRLSEELWREAVGKALVLAEGERMRAGILVLKPDQRLPEKGFSVHEEEDEFALVISGKIKLVTKRGEIVISEGEVLFNPRGTPHRTENPSNVEARILWVLSR